MHYWLLWCDPISQHAYDLEFSLQKMSTPFGKLTQAEKTKFWQEIAEKLQRVLEICRDQISAQVLEEAQTYLAHNELGLAWETICGELIGLEKPLSKAIQELLLETGKRMGLNAPGNPAYELWAEVKQLNPIPAPERRLHPDF